MSVDVSTEGPHWTVRSALVNPLQSSGAPPQVRETSISFFV